MNIDYMGKNSLAHLVEKIYGVFAQVEHSHSKSDIRDLPEIPTKVSDLVNDSGFKTTDNNTTYTLTKDGETIVLTGSDGSAMSVKDSDTKITVDSELSASSTNPVQNKVIYEEFDDLARSVLEEDQARLTEAKEYADSAATTAANDVKNDLLNGAGVAYDTLKELGDLIVDNADAIDALETIASGKADAVHAHAIADVTNLQSSLDAKQATITGGATTIASSNLTANRALISNGSGKVAVSAVTSTELGYLDGVTSAIQAQLDGKQATINGGASTIASSNLTASRALISNSSGKVAVSAVTSTELGYLDGVSSNIQTQMDGKVLKSGDTMTGQLTMGSGIPIAFGAGACKVNYDSTRKCLNFSFS